MRRDRKTRGSNSLKYQIYISGIVLVVLIITFITVYFVYKNKLKKLSESFTTPELVTSLVPNSANEISNDISQASSELSKTINEILDNNITENDVELNNTQTETQNVESIENKVEEQLPTEQVAEPVEEKRVLEFCFPVEGEIVKEFAMDNLLFSETLQEWTTHPGIDIKCTRTTVIKSVESGTVLAIKNDPRYGTTVIIDHGDGYKTVYSNLLTTEFVQEGEEVSKGQSLGTVGNSAVFEIADEAHLHFEMLKDEIYLDPTLYLK